MSFLVFDPHKPELSFEKKKDVREKLPFLLDLFSR